MTGFFLKIYDFLQSHHRLCMALIAATFGILVVMMSMLNYNENIYDFMPMKGNDRKAITLYQDISGGQRIVAMISSKKGKADVDDRLMEAVDTFAEKLQTGTGKKHIAKVTSQVDYDKISGVTDFVYSNLPLMLSDSDYVRMERLLATPNYVNDQLANDVQMIMMPTAGLYSDNIGNDPLGLFTPALERLRSRQSSLPFEIDNGYIFTPGRKYAIVLINSPYGATESANNALLVNYVDSVAHQTMAVMPDVSVGFTGSPVIAVGNAKQIKQDSRLAVAIAVILITVLLVLSFRRLKSLALIGLSIVFGWIFAMGFIALLRSDVSLIVLGIGSIIIGIAVNYPLHFVAHTDHGGSAREVLKDMVPPLLIGNITTVGAFAALIPLDAPALRDLGLFASLMLVGTILFVLIFLPHLVTTRTGGKEHLLFGKISSAPVHSRWWAVVTVVVLTLFFGYFGQKTTFDANMHHVNYMDDNQTKLLSDLQASAGVSDTTNVYLVTEGSTWDEALSERTRLVPLLDSLRQQGVLNKYSDVTSFVCSKEEQLLRIQKWNEFWQRHRKQVAASLQAEAPRFGFSEEAFEGFNNIITADYQPHDFNYFEPIRSTLLTSSFSTSTGTCSTVDILNVKPDRMADVEARLSNAVADRGYAFDFNRMNSAVANSLSDNFNYIGFACGFIVFFFLWLSFGRLELSLLAFLPMAMGWIWILGMMYLFGMQFNIVNIILATFIFGQGDDYTIFMTDGMINEYAYGKKLMPSFKNSIIISALIMFIGIGSLIVARHPALHSLAEVTIVGMFTVVIMAWFVPSVVFTWLVKTDGHPRKFPVTLGQIVRTSYCTVVYLVELTLGCMLGLLLHLIPAPRRKKEAWFHRSMNSAMRVNIHHIWGVRPCIHNEVGEDFRKGSILLCNHQSILDPVYLLALNPKVMMLISGKVWNNPIVHPLFKLAGFICLDQPLETLEKEIAKAVSKGYSVVIFPEGKRTDGDIARFHKGAFHMARNIGADLLPVFLHGTGDVMQRGNGFASRGQIDIEIGKRVTAAELKQSPLNVQQLTLHFQHLYQAKYEEMRHRYETTHYFHHYVLSKYIYKGFATERETRHLLTKYDDFSTYIDGFHRQENTGDTVHVLHAGKGQFSLLFALVHPDITVHSYTSDADEAALLECCQPKPGNLFVHLMTEDQQGALTGGTDGTVIDFASLTDK
jgi:1-acyl-sn-glycerol-3-phosphate acyltransferase